MLLDNGSRRHHLQGVEQLLLLLQMYRLHVQLLCRRCGWRVANVTNLGHLVESDWRRLVVGR